MGQAMAHFEGRDPRDLFGAFVRRRTSSAKDLARVIGCDPRAAENYRAGRNLPSARHWPAIIAAFGRDVTEAVFHPEAAVQRLELELREHEQAVADARARLRDLAGVAPAPSTLRR